MSTSESETEVPSPISVSCCQLCFSSCFLLSNPSKAIIEAMILTNDGLFAPNLCNMVYEKLCHCHKERILLEIEVVNPLGIDHGQGSVRLMWKHAGRSATRLIYYAHCVKDQYVQLLSMHICVISAVVMENVCIASQSVWLKAWKRDVFGMRYSLVELKFAPVIGVDFKFTIIPEECDPSRLCCWVLRDLLPEFTVLHRVPKELDALFTLTNKKWLYGMDNL